MDIAVRFRSCAGFGKGINRYEVKIMISKKNKRKILVDNKVYWWQVHYDKDFLRPYIFISSDEDGLLLKQSYDKEITTISGSIIAELIKENNL